MKFIHISDLHLGKQLHGYSLIEDQKHVLRQIIAEMEKEEPDGLLIAGDVYDKAVPSAEAVGLLDDFLTEVTVRCPNTEVYLIGGNHDGPRRLEFAGRILEKHRLHLAGSAPDREHPDIVCHRLADEFGEVNIYLLPFLRASHVRELFPEQDILTCQDAYKALIEREKIDPEKRNVLVAHQFFTYGANGPVRCESESFSAGGLDAADVRTIFGGEEALFDYVALGHLHAPQSVGRKYIRYSGSPLKYSVSESGQRKSMTVVELGEKGNVALREIPFLPLRDVRLLEGTLARLTDPAAVKNGNAEDYVSVILTDEEELYDPRSALEQCYPNLLEWRVENSRTRHAVEDMVLPDMNLSPIELFEEFYRMMQGCGLSEEEEAYLRDVFDAVEEKEN